MKTTQDKCWHVGGVILMILMPLAFVGIVINDYAHPEWASDWLHDPRRYLPVAMWLVLAMVAAMGLWVWVEVRREKLNKDYEYLLGIIATMNRTGRRQEAKEAIWLYWRLVRARSLAKKNMLEKHFLETYRV